MKKQITLLLGVAIAFYACKKETTQTTPTPTTNEKVSVKVNLTGDITTSTAPLGAKAIVQTVLYGVRVKTAAGEDYAQGMFTNPDSISIELTKNETYTIQVMAIKKGTGNGLYYELVNNVPYLDTPFAQSVNNTLNYAADDMTKMYSNFVDSLTYSPITTAASEDAYTTHFYPEMDSYRGSVSITPTADEGTFSVELKRISFGVQFNIPNFTGGQVIALYPNYTMENETITPQNASSIYIYTSDRYYEEYVNGNQIALELNYIDAAGNYYSLGRLNLAPKRNEVTIVNITLPESPTNTSKAGISITETDWSGSNSVSL